MAHSATFVSKTRESPGSSWSAQVEISLQEASLLTTASAIFSTRIAASKLILIQLAWCRDHWIFLDGFSCCNLQACLWSQKIWWICLASSTELLLVPSTLAMFLDIQIWSQRITTYSWKSLAASSSKPNLVFGFRMTLTQSTIERDDSLFNIKGHGASSHTWATQSHCDNRCPNDSKHYCTNSIQERGGGTDC